MEIIQVPHGDDICSSCRLQRFLVDITQVPRGDDTSSSWILTQVSHGY